MALIGNPNSGKSTLFNILTGLKQKIANFPGVTVDKKTGFCKIVNSSSGKATSFEIIDLPGTYSLYPKSPDERIPFLTLCDPKDDCHPDIVIIIADSTNLKRSLFLASQVIDLKIPSILALNMSDIVKQNGININESELQERLGMRVVPISARYVKGIEELKQALVNPLLVPEQDIFVTEPLAPKVLKEIREKLNINNNYAEIGRAHV